MPGWFFTPHYKYLAKGRGSFWTERRMNRVSFFCTAVFATSCMVGCDSTPDGQKPVSPVEVTVLYKGSPVEGAQVTFVNDSGPPPAFGRTDASGKAKLSTYASFDGATLGSHKVAVTKQEFDGVQPKSVSEVDDPAYNGVGASPVPKVKDLLPKKYGQPTTSNLSATVEKKKNNEVKLELTD